MNADRRRWKHQRNARTLKRLVLYPRSSAFICGFILAASVTSTTSTAEEPSPPKREIKSTRPLAVTAGATAKISITGQDLAPQEVRFDDPRITGKIVKTTPLEPKSDADKARGNVTVEAEVTLPAGLPPQLYAFQLIHGGKEEPKGKIYVDTPCPEIEESEPNDTLRKPQALPAGPVAVLGTLDNEGVDVFQLNGKAGETYRIEVLARRMGAALDAVLRLRDPRLAPVRAAVDQGEDCAITYTLPMDGPYLIELFDGENRTGAGFIYRLRITPVLPPK
jgi:hypothetical protein